MEIKKKKDTLEKGKLVVISEKPKIIVYFDGEKYFAFSGICSHANWPLELGTVDGCTLTCVGHGWGYNITNGECKTNPGRSLKTYMVSDDGENIIIREKDRMRSTDGEKLTENEIKKNQTYKDDIENHIANRTFKNQKDYQFFKKIDKT